MNITVLGCGRWGSFHAWYAHRIGHNVTLWGRPGSPHLAELISQRQNEYLHLPLGIALTADLTAALAGADIIITYHALDVARWLGEKDSLEFEI